MLTILTNDELYAGIDVISCIEMNAFTTDVVANTTIIVD
jgi:hypothetical protein